MNHLMKRLLAFFLCCMLFCSPALAVQLDRTLSSFWDINTDVRFSISGALETLVPYGDETVALFNTALKHLSVSAEVRGEKTVLEVNVAGDPLVTLTETVTENGTQLTTPLLPNRTLISTGSVIDALGTEGAAPAFDLAQAIAEAKDCYEQLTDAIRPYAEEKAANYKIANVGVSRWSRIARLTPTQSAELSPLIAKLLGCGMDESYRQELRNMTYSKGFIVGLYQSGEGGDDLAVYIKGGVTFADGGYRTLSYQWAFADREDGKRIDTYKFEMNRSKGAKDDREISGSRERRNTEDGAELDSQSKCLVRNPDDGSSLTTTVTQKLKAKETGSERTLEGTHTTAIRTVKDGESSTVTTVITPTLTLLSSEGSGVISGQVAIERRPSSKGVDLSAIITFDEEPAEVFADAAETGMLFFVTEDAPQSSLMQNQAVVLGDDEEEDYLVGKPPAGYESYTAPKEMTVVDMDHLTDEEKAKLMDELAQNLAGKLLIAIAKLPTEDRALLQDNLSEHDFALLLSLVEGL